MWFEDDVVEHDDGVVDVLDDWRLCVVSVPDESAGEREDVSEYEAVVHEGRVFAMVQTD